MTSVARLALMLLMMGAVCAHAIPNAEVESVQMPAWVERDGQRSPLEAGAVLRNGDHIETGAGSRALLRLNDGSTVKLGENARFELNDMQRGGAGQGVFKATLSVLEGAFRFTTAAIYKFGGRREIDVRFRTVTAGIRGTDLWGKSAADPRHRLSHRRTHFSHAEWAIRNRDAATADRISGPSGRRQPTREPGRSGPARQVGSGD